MLSLFLEVSASFKRDNEDSAYLELRRLVNTTDYDKLMQAFNILNDYFDMKGITKIDTIKQYNSTNTEIENYEKGI